MPGDTVIVGPGVYTGESGAPGCDCFLAVNKPVALVSSDGAAATIIDGRAFQVDTNVLVIGDGAELGRPGKGFTMTQAGAQDSSGIAIDARNARIRGNQMIALQTPTGIGIATVLSNPGPMLIEQNQVVGWGLGGIDARGAGRTVRGNAVSLCGATGIQLDGPSIATGNVVSGGQAGIYLQSGAQVIGNAVRSALVDGIFVDNPFPGAIARNDLERTPTTFGNCGFRNDASPSTIIAAGNYWGAPTGPGPDPADAVCNASGATTVTTPFATAPFKVRTRIKP
jgi:hypothetical protein